MTNVYPHYRVGDDQQVVVYVEALGHPGTVIGRMVAPDAARLVVDALNDQILSKHLNETQHQVDTLLTTIRAMRREVDPPASTIVNHMGDVPAGAVAVQGNIMGGVHLNRYDQR